MPGLITLVLGFLMRQGWARTAGTALCVDVLGGGLTFIAYGVFLDHTGALS